MKSLGEVLNALAILYDFYREIAKFKFKEKRSYDGAALTDLESESRHPAK